MLTYIWIYLAVGFILICFLDWRESQQQRRFSMLQFIMGMLLWPIFLVAALVVVFRGDN